MSLSFFISNIIDTISVPALSESRKIKSPLLPALASLSFSKYALGNAVARIRLNSVSQCCSSVSPTILVERRAFMSLRRSIASSRSLICVSYLSRSDFSASCFSNSACFKLFLSESRSFSTLPSASAMASFCAASPALSLASANFDAL